MVEPPDEDVSDSIQERNGRHLTALSRSHCLIFAVGLIALAGPVHVSPRVSVPYPVDFWHQAQERPSPQPLPVPIRLLRIPKAGSSSFSAFLRLQYNCTSDQHPPGDCTRKNAKACPAVDGCTDHKAPPDWRNSNDTVPPMVTFVRDPITRYVSAYHYPGHHGLGTRGDMELHTRLFPEYDNTQVNYLSRNAIGTWDNRAAGNRAREAPPDDSTLPDDAERTYRLAEAVALTEKVVFVGLVEFWNDSLRLFCRMYVCANLEQSLKSKPERQAPKKDDDQQHYPFNDSTAISAIRQSNADDLQLYQAAAARFCRDLLYYKKDPDFAVKISHSCLQFCRTLAERGTTV